MQMDRGKKNSSGSMFGRGLKLRINVLDAIFLVTLSLTVLGVNFYSIRPLSHMVFAFSVIYRCRYMSGFTFSLHMCSLSQCSYKLYTFCSPVNFPFSCCAAVHREGSEETLKDGFACLYLAVRNLVSLGFPQQSTERHNAEWTVGKGQDNCKWDQSESNKRVLQLFGFAFGCVLQRASIS